MEHEAMQHAMQRAILLALAALLDLIEEVDAEPIAPCLHLRALLAFLAACGDGERHHFDGFWKMMVDPTIGQRNATALGYMRKTYARTHYNGIIHSLGLERICPDYNKRIHRLRVTSDPESRARHHLADMVREAAREQEIIASKGHPRTGAAKRLLADRIAAGKSIDSIDEI